MVRSGHYITASEVVCHAVRLLEELEGDYEEWGRYVRRKIERGLEQVDAGQCISLEELEERIAKRREKYRKP